MTCSIKGHFDGELLELRNCPLCSSTLALPLPVPAPVELAEGTYPGVSAVAEWEWGDCTPVMTVDERAAVPSAVSPAAPVHRMHDLLGDLWRLM